MADEHFIKVHRSYIVNICYVAMIQMHEIIMSDGTFIPIPEKKYTAVKKLLLQRFEG